MFTLISAIFPLDLGTVLTVSLLSFLLYDFSMKYWNCSESVLCYILPFISSIFLLDLGTVMTMWYFLFFILFLRFFY
jgi:hypothetical protein